jgi:hypothetical protein
LRTRAYQRLARFPTSRLLVHLNWSTSVNRSRSGSTTSLLA